jgi:predicted phosphoadenosine phosphosulfate sulfurtransferase
MPKRKLGIDVLAAARQRTTYAFDHFPKVYVAFSGGKDSTVMLHLAADEARKRGRRFGLVYIDLEGQYQATVDHIERCYRDYEDVADRFWICLPIHLRNSVSVYEPFWQPWDPEAKEAWIRPLPDDCINDPAHFPFFYDGMEFEELVPAFGEWYGDGEPVACLVGIRSDESLNRFRTISSTSKTTPGS